jgi:hypothetical protein
MRKKIRVSRPRGPGMSEQHCKVLALPMARLPRWWPDCPGGDQIAQALAISLKILPDRSSTGQKGEPLTLSLPRSAGSVKESDPVIPCRDSAALVRNDQ